MSVKAPQAPAGRFRANCRPESASGEAFRDDVLIPALAAHKGTQPLEVDLSECVGVPPSWAEESFGGLVRKLGPSVLARLTVVDRELPKRAAQCEEFMVAAAHRFN